MKVKGFVLVGVLLAHLTMFAQQNGSYVQSGYREKIDLSGKWLFQLDPDSTLKPTSKFNDVIYLPGTTDTNRKGNAATKKDETTHLTRKYSYVGKAWYQVPVRIPKSWKGQQIVLYMERTKPTTVYVDGKPAGSSNDISTPQEYILSKQLKPGVHYITVMVDNSENTVPPQIISNSHAYTEDTQTNWNGIIGRIYLEKRAPTHIDNLIITTDSERKEVQVTVNIDGQLKADTKMKFILIPWGGDYGYVIGEKMVPKTQNPFTHARVIYRDDSLKLWSEHHPSLYRIHVTLDGYDEMEKTFGVRSFTTQGTQFAINGNTTFLRGKHDACVFPLTGHVPMTMEEWRRYFQICKGYGINHVRFHSWCPPEACFLAADIEGIYLQPELPFWGDFNKDDRRLMDFLMKEGTRIITTYGHHPSFVMMALGNELWGDIPTMQLFTKAFKKMDPTKLFTFGSNYYLGYQGWKEGMDFFVTCRNGGEEWGKFNTHTRGSFSFADAAGGGMINSIYPNSIMNFAEGIKDCQVPIIGHETAQFQTYPDYNEISKYSGVLYPYNMEVFRSRLEKAGMLDQAADFHKASGLWSVELYKQEIEMALRTPGMGGFQLLDLQDYPGQGSAYVGILDAFMEPKGITTPQEWRQWCSPIVPLFLTEKFCWTTDETVKGKIQLANYSESIDEYRWNQGVMTWQLMDREGMTLKRGKVSIPENSHGLTDLGDISIDVSDLQPQKYTLVLKSYYNKESGKCFENYYYIWVFPSMKNPLSVPKDILVAHRYDAETARILSGGGTVLLMPDSTQMKDLTVGGLFQTDYWNYRMFKTICENNKKSVSPGTLGILTNPEHPIFNSFPTEMHTNWQWFPIIKASRPFMLDNTAAAYRPIVQVIDNVERNHKLGLIFEFAVNKGKLLVCMSPLDQLQQYPEARQLYKSILQYMQSPDFSPKTQITSRDLQQLFTTPVVEGKIGELNNISPY